MLACEADLVGDGVGDGPWLGVLPCEADKVGEELGVGAWLSVVPCEADAPRLIVCVCVLELDTVEDCEHDGKVKLAAHTRRTALLLRSAASFVCRDGRAYEKLRKKNSPLM